LVPNTASSLGEIDLIRIDRNPKSTVVLANLLRILDTQQA
jgi:hypothetical protein